MKAPDSDIDLAMKKRLKFEICTKAARGKPWITVVDNLDLPEAAEKASLIAPDVYETGILCVRPVGGFIYWTSLHADSFNSAVIEMDID